MGSAFLLHSRFYPRVEDNSTLLDCERGAGSGERGVSNRERGA